MFKLGCAPLDSISRCKSLQTLRIVLEPFCVSIPGVILILQAIVPHLRPIDVVLVYRKHYFHCCHFPSHGSGRVRMRGGDECVTCNQEHLEYFRIFGGAHKVREFRLTLCVEVPGSMVDSTTRALEYSVRANKDGELSYLLSGASVVSTIPQL